MDYREIKSKHLVKKAILNAAYKATETHVGSALSCADIMEALYFQVANVTKDNCKSDMRDRIVMSKGHAALAQYACLMLKGIIPRDVFDTYDLDGGLLPAHLDHDATDGIEASTGMSLGHGVGLAEGFALANRLKKIKSRIFVIVGDGELQEGSIWEGLVSVTDNKPRIVIANTIKGHGLPAPFENTVKSHYVKLTAEQYQTALKVMDGE